jgi:SAM-dependent methyltransferase
MPHTARDRAPARAPVLAHALAFAVAFCCSSANAQDEVPFVTTPDNVTLAMLDLAGVGPTDHVVDLGSGDGRIVITAARRHGASGLGVEIVGELVAKSRDHARRAGVADRARFVEQDLFATDLRAATVVTLYLLQAVNLQLRPRLLALAPGTRIVSHDWDMGDWRPDRTIEVEAPDKTVGREKRSRVHLWTVPAKVHGTWCGVQGRLDVTQRFADFSATLLRHGEITPLVVFDGRIAAHTLHAQGDAALLRADGDRLRIERIEGPGLPFAGQTFERSAEGRCR